LSVVTGHYGGGEGLRQAPTRGGVDAAIGKKALAFGSHFR